MCICFSLCESQRRDSGCQLLPQVPLLAEPQIRPLKNVNIYFFIVFPHIFPSFSSFPGENNSFFIVQILKTIPTTVVCLGVTGYSQEQGNRSCSLKFHPVQGFDISAPRTVWFMCCQVVCLLVCLCQPEFSICCSGSCLTPSFCLSPRVLGLHVCISTLGLGGKY